MTAVHTHTSSPGPTGSTSGSTQTPGAIAARGTVARSAARARLDRFLARPTVAWGTPQAGVVRPTGTELAASGFLAAGDWVGGHLLADAALTSGAAAGALAARRVQVAA